MKIFCHYKLFLVLYGGYMWYIIVLVMALFYYWIRGQNKNIWLLEKTSIIHKF